MLFRSEEMDIHPKNKKIVGHRLALLAKGHIYGEKILCDAPMFSKYKKVKAGIELYFTNADGGLDVCGGKDAVGKKKRMIPFIY